MSRECEERMELIDALGEAREQLLHLKKPAGSFYFLLLALSMLLFLLLIKV